MEASKFISEITVLSKPEGQKMILIFHPLGRTSSYTHTHVLLLPLLHKVIIKNPFDIKKKKEDKIDKKVEEGKKKDLLVRPESAIQGFGESK